MKIPIRYLGRAICLLIFCLLDKESDGLLSDMALPTPLPALVDKLVHPVNRNKPNSSNSKPPAQGLLSFETLRYVYVLARHGSRSPLSSYPTDPYPYYDERYWPDGPGYLTRFGKQEEYEVGERLRSRYGGFLGANYSPNETKFTSNLSPRDFESASCMAAGLFPPVGYQIWNPNLLWNPIPIRYENFDVVDLLTSGDCPVYLSEALARLKKLDSQSYKYKNVLEYISRFSGIKDQTISQIGPLFDILYMQERNRLTLPDWTKPVYPEQLKFFFVLMFNTLLVGSEKAVITSGGTVLGKIWNKLHDKARGELKPNLKMEILAAHDATIKTVLSALDVDMPYFIQTSAYLLWELHENSRGQFVQIIYYNSSSNTRGEVVDVPLCSTTPCPLAEFGRIASSKQVQSLDELCYSQQDITDYRDSDLFLTMSKVFMT